MISSIPPAITHSLDRLTATIPWDQVGYYWALLAGAGIGVALLIDPILTPVVAVAFSMLYLILPDAAQPVEITVEVVE